MIEYRFGPDDLGRVRFAISPLFELASSRQVLRDPARHSIHEPWARAERAAVSALDSGCSTPRSPKRGYCYLPDFVTPPPERPVARLGGRAPRVRATPRAVARELGWAYPGGGRRRAARTCSAIPRPA